MGPKKPDEAAAAPEQRQLDMSPGLWTFNEDNGWANKLNELKEEAAKLKKCTIQMHPRMRADEAIASPEAFDQQTDVMMLPVVPPTEVIKQKIMKKAADLTEQEQVDTLDSLISYFTMFCRGTASNVSVETCFYMHEKEYAEGHPIGVFSQSLLTLMIQVTNLIDIGNVRDGDEEFSQQMIGRSGPSAGPFQVDLEKLDVEAGKNTNVGKRFALLAALARYVAAALNIARKGAVEAHVELRSAVDALLAAILAIEGAHPAGGAVVPPKAAFTPHAALWDTASIPHKSVDPCPWQEAMAYLTALGTDTQVLYEEWLPLKGDILAVFQAVKAYCHRDPAPSLVTRSVASVFVMHGQQPFGGDSILLLLLTLLRDRFGAPWFHMIVRPQSDDDQRLAKQIVDYAAKSNNLDATRASQAQQEEEMKRHIVLGVSSTVMELGHVLNRLMTAYLKNRGRCHRNLVNLLPAIVNCQGQAWRLERSSFVVASQTTAKAYAGSLGRNEVLFSVVTDLLVDTCQQICVLTQKLGLLTTPELAPLLVYYQHFSSTRGETAGVLYPTSAAVSEFKEVAGRRNTPPVLAMRVVKPMPAEVLINAEVTMGFTRAVSWALNALKPKIPSLAMPAQSLQSLSNVFNFRFRPLQMALVRPPLMTFQDIQEYTKMPDPAKFIAQAVESFKSLAARLPKMRTLTSDPALIRMIDAVEKAAKKNAVVVGLLGNQKMAGFTATLEIDAEFPWVVTLTAVKP